MFSHGGRPVLPAAPCGPGRLSGPRLPRAQPWGL